MCHKQQIKERIICCSHLLGVAHSKESQAGDVPSSSFVGSLGLNSDFDTQKLSNVNGKIKEAKTNWKMIKQLQLWCCNNLDDLGESKKKEIVSLLRLCWRPLPCASQVDTHKQQIYCVNEMQVIGPENVITNINCVLLLTTRIKKHLADAIVSLFVFKLVFEMSETWLCCGEDVMMESLEAGGWRISGPESSLHLCLYSTA